jgi:bifunctional N-acetylglucosamine-1-phosphate-uridyltransferase/glucosamine-1-phosphate-acetyltransferase GlmU-like protein
LADQDTVKKVAGGAAIGAAAAVIAPIGLATGALIGAGIVAYRHVNKKKNQEK